LKKHLSLILIVLTGIFSRSCQLINPPEDIPAYLHIDSFSLHGNYDSFGSLSHKITDAWVIVNDKLIGVFELPATFPVLANDIQKLIIMPGIKENGISNTRLPYPFYTYYIDNHLFKPSTTDTIQPNIWYAGNKFLLAFNEDFEGGNVIFDPSNLNNALVYRTNSNSEKFEGDYSLKVVLPTKNDIFEIEGEDLYDIPRNKSAFIEINFKTDEVLTIGYYSISLTNSVKRNLINLNPTKTWKKVYANLGTELLYEPQGNVFRFFLGAVNTASDTSYIFIDNIKLLVYK